MRLITRAIIAIILIAVSYADVFATWKGYETVISGSWGTQPGQLGIEIMETSTIVPSLEAVLPDGRIIISDSVNNKQILANPDGKVSKEIQWILQRDSASKEIYIIPEFGIGKIMVYAKDGNIITTSAAKYYLRSSDGQILQTYSVRPTEAGDVKETTQSDRSYKVTVTYPDKIYSLIVPRQSPDQIIRDSLGNLSIVQRIVERVNTGMPNEQAVQHYRIIRYNTRSKEVGRLDLPKDVKKLIGIDKTVGKKWKIVASYGQPVVASNGDVYALKRTPEKYFILRWAWMDDSNDGGK